MIFSRFGRKAHDETTRTVYERIVAAARRRDFYIDHGVPDTLEGRFEMLVLHTFLYLHRLRDEDPAARASGQQIFDMMFADMDRSLREMGVGDLTVPKKIKKMAQHFYGRTAAFDAALAQSEDADLEEVIARNVYPDREDAAPRAKHLGAYMRRAVVVLAGQPVAALTTRGPDFPDAELGYEP